MRTRRAANGTCCPSPIRSGFSDRHDVARGLATPPAPGELHMYTQKPEVSLPPTGGCTFVRIIMFDLDTLNGLFGDAVTVADGRVTVTRPEAIAGTPMDQLVRAAVFADGVEREYARWLIWEIGQAVGVQPASIHDLYMARGRGEIG